MTPKDMEIQELRQKLKAYEDAQKQVKPVLYLCDRRACEKCHSMDCSHTSDISHATNFTRKYGTYIEERMMEI